jgi:hypothetical protein
MDCGVVALDPLISLNNKMHCVPSIIIILLCTWTVCVNQVTKTMSLSARSSRSAQKDWCGAPCRYRSDRLQGSVWSSRGATPGADKSVAFPDRSIHVGLSSASAHGGGAVAAVHRIGRYICVAATHMLPCAMLVCVCDRVECQRISRVRR